MTDGRNDPTRRGSTEPLRSFSAGLDALETGSSWGEPDLGTLLYLSRADIEAIAPSPAVIRDLVRRLFEEKGHGRTESPPKRGILPTATSHIRAMKARVPYLNAAGVKWISAYAENAARGLPTINGLVVLNDLATGLPRAIMDCAWITAMRTAACTVISAEHLARSESRTVGIIACGVQGRSNLEALCDAFPIEHAVAYDLVPAHAERFAAEMSDRLGIAIDTTADIEGAVRDRDIVVTSLPGVKNPAPPIDAGVLSPGSFACLLDFDAAFTGAAMRETDKLVTDDVAQVDFFRSIGYFLDTPDPDGDLGKITAGRQRGRESDEWRTMSINMGIGLLDIGLASLLHDRARERGVGVELPL